MSEHDRQDRDDERLSGWIRAVRADADPALWTRVRARIEAGDGRDERLPAWLQWLARPAALGVATAALALVCGAGLITMRSAGSIASESSTAASLTEALLDEITGSGPARIDAGTPEPAAEPAGVPGDSGVTG